MRISKYIKLIFSIVFCILILSCKFSQKIHTYNPTITLFHNVTLNQYEVILINPSDCNICEDKILNYILEYDSVASSQKIIIQPNNRMLFKK